MRAVSQSLKSILAIEKTTQPWIQSPTPTLGIDAHEALLKEKYIEMLKAFPMTAPQHHFETLSILEILGKSPEMGELLRRIQQHPNLAAALGDKALQHTIWVPTDLAFSQLDRDLKGIPEQSWMAILQHHISPHPLPTSRLLEMGNMPTLLRPPGLNGDLRLRLRPSTAGIQVNFQDCIKQSDIIASNGVVHVISTLLLPPPSIMTLITSMSDDDNFGIAKEALHKTGLAKVIDGMTGGTLFLPSNSAFEKLGGATNKFLFETEDGERYLEALLKLHFSPRQTLYSNALYMPGSTEPTLAKSQEPPTPRPTEGLPGGRDQLYRLRKGTKTFRLSTSLAGHNLDVCIARYGSIIHMLANKWTPVKTQDLIASNGVVHLIDRVLLPVEDRQAIDLDVITLKTIFEDVM